MSAVPAPGAPGPANTRQRTNKCVEPGFKERRMSDFIARHKVTDLPDSGPTFL